MSAILGQIGDTPIVPLERCVPSNGAEIWLKLENRNPTGSMKDRMALAMIEGAERDGLIGPETTIVEYSGGSTGPALALVCSVKGYRCRIVISDSHTEERIQLMRALGAEVEIIPSVEGRPPRVSAEDIRRMAERSGELAALPDHYATLQFTNPYIVPAVRDGLGREIWEQMEGRVTAFVQGVGTAGSIIGVAQALKPHGVHICALEPAGSAAISGGPQGPFATQGWSGMVPPRWDRDWIDEVGQVEDYEAIEMTRRLSREEGIFAGISTGANVVGAIRLAEWLGPDAVVVTLAVDTGFKYMSVAPYGQPPYAAGIVGRDEELAAVESFLATAGGGRQTLVLEGEAGIGKTTLLQAAARGARERSYTVLACRPADVRTRRSFGSLGDLLGPALDSTLELLPQPQRQGLELALRLRAPSGPPAEPRAIGLAVLGVLRQLAALQPVVVAIDDAECLDAESGAALTFALRQVEADRVSVIVARSPGAPSGLELEPFVRLLVGPLSLGALHRLLQERLETVFPRPQIVRLHRTAAGNPFYAFEVAAARLPLSESDEPLTRSRLQELLRTRLTLQPPNVQDVLFELAARSDAHTDLPDREGVELAAAAGFVEVEGDRVRFAHPLLAEAAYDQAGPERRAEIHGRLAELAEDSEERARHLALATDGHSTQTDAALEEAARDAASRGGAAAAVELAELALQRTPDDDPTTLVRRELFAAETILAAGDVGRARELLEGRLGDLAPGRDRAGARLLLAMTRLDDLEAASELAARALLDAGEDQVLRATISWRLALLWHARGDLERALAHAQAARAAAETVGDARLLVRVLSFLALLEALASPKVDGGTLELALELEGETERPTGTYSPRLVLGTRLLLAGSLDEAREALEADEADARAAGDEGGRPLVLAQLAELELRAGRWELASRYAREGLEIAEQVGPAHFQAALLAVHARVSAHRGEVEAARTAASRGAWIAEAAKAGLSRAENVAVLGLAELSHRPQEADRHLRPLLAEAERMGFLDPAAYRYVVDAIEAMIESGAVAEARRHVDWLEALAQDRPSPWALGAARRSLGIWLAASGQSGEAEAALRAALSQHEVSGEPFERGRTLLALGTALRRAKQKRAARDSIEACLKLFEQLGAATWAARAHAELARIAGRRRGPSGLTPSERRVAELVSEGLSNKEVAAALHVTVKTVEGSLSRIYAKLGIRSRAALARLSAEQDMTQAKT